ncbi:MAG: hypothetical protein J7M26_07455, partial [Armatimonadetes bacterium]|nr:hypothetical protein [Armatimonadota bacterium]
AHAREEAVTQDPPHQPLQPDHDQPENQGRDTPTSTQTTPENSPAFSERPQRLTLDKPGTHATECALSFELDGILRDLYAQHPEWNDGKRQKWRKEATYALDNRQCTLEELLRWLTDPETRPDLGDMDVPRAWFRRMFSLRRTKQQRGGRSRDAPGPKAPVPAGQHPSGEVSF